MNEMKSCELEFASHPANLARVRSFVREFLGALRFSPAENDLMVLGIDEACTNVIRYAYGHESSQPIHLSCECDDDGVCFRLRDYGSPVENHRLHGRPLDAPAPGGLGLFLIRKAFDQVDYQPRALGTELVLGKKYGAPARCPAN